MEAILFINILDTGDGCELEIMGPVSLVGDNSGES
jgi:hypothetical protein